MNRRAVVIGILSVGAIAFAGGAYVYNTANRAPAPAASSAALSELVRPHSPVIGRTSAPVTIVEFFDPSCETCRAFYPIVKQILARHPDDVRVVIRYAPFHGGSDEAVRILETARVQGKFERVLEALLVAQPKWAAHGAPDLNLAWEVAGGAGLDVTRAKREMSMPGIDAVVRQDMLDVQAFNVKGTPTFFVNGKPLPSFSAQSLYDLVINEIKSAKGDTTKKRS